MLFEGKMRALFSLLFGASMLLFIERADAAGRDGDVIQLRRLGWLLLFGYLHYILLWWGDILFLYAVAGVLALFMRELPVRTLVIAALAIFTLWHAAATVTALPDVQAEERVRLGTASALEARNHGRAMAQLDKRNRQELREFRSGFAEQAATKLTRRPFYQLGIALNSLGETLPLMLIGMVLYRTGFFAGGWPPKRLRWIAVAGIGAGGLLTIGLLALAWPRHFPFQAMYAAAMYGLALPHLAMALGYAALLGLAAPRLLASRLGEWLAAAGRMAFSNYLGTTVLMTAIFYGWGLGLVGTLGHAAQLPFVLLGWALMLAWSKPWLARFRQGPLEWLWRSLTEWRALPFLK